MNYGEKFLFIVSQNWKFCQNLSNISHLNLSNIKFTFFRGRESKVHYNNQKSATNLLRCFLSEAMAREKGVNQKVTSWAAGAFGHQESFYFLFFVLQQHHYSTHIFNVKRGVILVEEKPRQWQYPQNIQEDSFTHINIMQFLSLMCSWLVTLNFLSFR